MEDRARTSCSWFECLHRDWWFARYNYSPSWCSSEPPQASRTTSPPAGTWKTKNNNNNILLEEASSTFVFLVTLIPLVPAQPQPDVLGEGEWNISQHLFQLLLLHLATDAKQVPVEVPAVQQSVRPAQLRLHHGDVPAVHLGREGRERSSQFWEMWPVRSVQPSCRSTHSMYVRHLLGLYCTDITSWQSI